MTSFIPLDHAWNFRRLTPAGAATAWTEVGLPHSPFVADRDGRDHWFGECEYQRTLTVPPAAATGRVALFVGAAMHSTIILLDGIECGRHAGGYLPFEVDLTARVADGHPHQLTLRLANHDNPDVPPGKPFAELDFCWYGGLYRGVELRCYPPQHITDPLGATTVAGGGVFVRTLAASTSAATIRVRTHVRNVADAPRELRLDIELRQGDAIVARARSAPFVVAAGAATAVETDLAVTAPQLWSPDAPALHHAQVTLQAADGTALDARTVRFGIRQLAFSRAAGFVLNGRRRRFRGTNRHQDHPHVGYAVPRAAHFRDARRIKEAGFDYVRLSHYPQSPDFLDACDELGLLVMACIPGWQFLGGEIFREACYRNARELVRRDRNHPCVVLWELSLNETDMDDAFMARLHAIGHEEYPDGQMFTCGWIDRYDVFIHSRQHGRMHTWQNGDKALVIAEYGNWEFFATNAGFDQKTGAGIYDAWSTSRQFRRDGERGLRQQVANHALALNDTLASPAALDGLWVMFDYARGYNPVRAADGVMDVFRVAKFSYHFYRSQRDPDETGAGWSVGPVAFIASHWVPASDLRVLVFSNCEEVELRCNGTVIGRHRPARTAFAQNLPHPPFVFDLPRFVPGVLEAVGFIGGRPQAAHTVTTPGAVARIVLAVDDHGRAAAAGEADVLFAHARLVDAAGTLCIEETSAVTFALDGAAELIGPTTVDAEAGIASVVVRVPPAGTRFQLHAHLAAGPVPPATLRWTASTSAG